MPPTPAARGDGRGQNSNRGPRGPRRRENEAQDRGNNRRAPRSIAVVELEVTLQSQQAQYVQERALFRVMRSLYTISVILRHIAKPKEVDDVLAVVFSRIDEVKKAIEADHARLTKLLEDSGAAFKLSFTRPTPVTVQISSPHARRYLELIQLLDKHMNLVEGLWLCELLSDTQRHEAQEGSTGQVLALAGQINEIETRARDAARRQGKEEDVAAELAETAASSAAPDDKAAETASVAEVPTDGSADAPVDDAVATDPVSEQVVVTEMPASTVARATLANAHDEPDVTATAGDAPVRTAAKTAA